MLEGLLEDLRRVVHAVREEELLAESVRSGTDSMDRRNGKLGDLEYEVRRILKRLTSELDKLPVAFGREIVTELDVCVGQEVVRQVDAIRASGREASAKDLVTMKYGEGHRKHRPVLFRDSCRLFDSFNLLGTAVPWGLAECFKTKFMNISRFADFIDDQMRADVYEWCYRDAAAQVYLPPHASLLDLTNSQKTRLVKELSRRALLVVPKGVREWFRSQMHVDVIVFTEKLCRMYAKLFTELLHWLKAQLAVQSVWDRADLGQKWFDFQAGGRFWAEIWREVEASTNSSAANSTSVEEIIRFFTDALVSTRFEIVMCLRALTEPRRLNWEALDTVFVFDCAHMLDTKRYECFREAMNVVGSRQKKFASFFLLFDDTRGLETPPPNLPNGQRRKLHMPFRLGIAADNLWTAAKRVDLEAVKKSSPDAIVATVEEQLTLFDDSYYVTPTPLLIDRVCEPSDSRTLANNISLNLLEHLKILALFGSPVHFPLFFQSRDRNVVLDFLKNSIMQEKNFLEFLIQRLPSEDEGDVVPHVDHIKPIAVQELLQTQRLNWEGIPDSPAVKCLQAWQACLVNTDFGTGWVGLPSIQTAAFLKALGEPDRNYWNYHDGWIRLGCFVYKENVDKMELSNSEAFEAFIRGVAFCDERSVLIPVCGVASKDELISASCMLGSFRFGDQAGEDVSRRTRVLSSS